MTYYLDIYYTAISNIVVISITFLLYFTCNSYLLPIKKSFFLSPKSFTIQSSQLLCILGLRKKFLEYVYKECLYAKIAKFALQICSRAFWTFQKEIHRWRCLEIYSGSDSIFWMCIKEIRRIKIPFFQLIHIPLHVLLTLFQMYYKI